MLKKVLVSSITMIALMAMSIVPASAASPKIQSNTSTSEVRCNLSQGALPPNSDTLKAGGTYYFNLSCTEDNQLKSGALYIKMPGQGSYSCAGSYTANNYFRFTSVRVNIPNTAGTLSYYWKLQDKRTGKWTSYSAKTRSVSGGSSGGSYSGSNTSRDRAVQWCESQVGRSIDQDGAYGAQCVDLIKAYYSYLGKSPVRGNGKDYATNSLPSGFSRIKGASPQPGDVIIYTTGSWGHVAIMGNNGVSYHQNYNGVQKVVKVTKNPTSCRGGYWGVIRPNF